MNRFPAQVPAEPYPSASRKTFFHRKKESVPITPARPSARLRMLLLCLIPAAALCAVLIALAVTAHNPDGWGQALGQGILQGGLPPTGELPPVGAGTTADTHTDSPDSDTVLEAPTDSEEPSTDDPDAEEPCPLEPETAAAETAAVETVADGPPETEPPVTQPSDSGAVTEPPREPDTDPVSETDAPAVKEEPAVPEGCYPVITVDMSREDLGVGYIDCDPGVSAGSLPDAGGSAGPLWSTDGPPTVLIVNTHPFEGYGDGSAWYDPTAGGLAQTDTPSAAEGTVALGAALARSLRGMGVTVIHLRIAVSSEDSAADIYDRTETVIRSYCRLYPDIGLILDLRRSAELTADGGILRTEGSLGGQPCAQLRISVSGGRDPSAVSGDLAVALALRSGLWDMASTACRPVRVKAGAGLAGDLDGVRILTLDAGSAGNTYAEAARLTAPVAAVLSGLILDGN